MESRAKSPQPLGEPRAAGGGSRGPGEQPPAGEGGKGNPGRLRPAAPGRVGATPAAQGRAEAAAPRRESGGRTCAPMAVMLPAAPRDAGGLRPPLFISRRAEGGQPPRPPRPQGRGALRAPPRLSQQRGPGGRSRAGPGRTELN